ncbi:MAG: DUF805 domain-containing protein [Pseudomonadota bacterium]
MDFSQAVRTCISKYADFNGRASRSEYWWFFLFVFLVSVLLGFVSDVLSGLFCLGMLLPSVAAAARRLHDTDRSGWWQLIWLLPVIGWIWLIVLLALPSQQAANSHGPAPAQALPAAG